MAKIIMGLLAGVLIASLPLGAQAQEINPDAAKKLAKQNNCYRCHAVERDKNGPGWAEIGTKYRNKPDGEAKLVKHLTSAPKVKLLEDNVEEEHKIAKFREHADLVNLARWILSL